MADEANTDDVRDRERTPFSMPFTTGDLMRVNTPAPAGSPQGAAPGADPTMRELLEQQIRRQFADSQRLEQAQMDDLARRQQAQKLAIGAGFARDQANRTVANAPLPELHTPNRQPLPERPKFQGQPVEQAMASPLSVLALFGGLLAKRTATAGLRTMTAAIEAMNKGDLQQYEIKRAQYQDELQSVIENNREEHVLYQEAWDNRKRTFDERVAKLQMLSTQYGNGAMAQALASGHSAEAIQSVMDARGKAITQLEKLVQLDGGGTGRGGVAATDIAARQRTLMDKDPKLTLDEARIRATEEHYGDVVKAKEKAKASEAFGKVDPTLQNIIGGFPAAKERFTTTAFKFAPGQETRLLAAHRVLGETERVADYVAKNPDALGALATISNKTNATTFTGPVIDPTKPGAEAAAATAADEAGGKIRALGGKFALPDGRTLTPGMAEKAAILQKMLFQMALVDAGQMSASGRGGTVFLDKAMMDRVYHQMTNPYVLLNYLAERTVPAASEFKHLDPNIDFTSPQAPREYRSQLLVPGGIEKMLGEAYPSPRKPPQVGQEFMFQGRRVRYRGGDPADGSSYEIIPTAPRSLKMPAMPQ